MRERRERENPLECNYEMKLSLTAVHLKVQGFISGKIIDDLLEILYFLILCAGHLTLVTRSSRIPSRKQCNNKIP